MAKLKVAMVANDMPPTPDWVVRQLEAEGIELAESVCTGPDEVKPSDSRTANDG